MYFEISWCDSSGFVLLAQDCFYYSESFIIPHKFSDHCVKNVIGVLTVVVVVKWFSCAPLFCDPIDCSSPGFLVHGISQARIV